MNCPYCQFRFGVLAANGDIMAVHLAPVLCERCENVSLLVDGNLRKASENELTALKSSPAWQAIEHFKTAVKRAKRHQNN